MELGCREGGREGVGQKEGRKRELERGRKRIERQGGRGREGERDTEWGERMGVALRKTEGTPSLEWYDGLCKTCFVMEQVKQ